jgi:hypothetical protein
VSTSVLDLNIADNDITDEETTALINALIARNKRLSKLFLFDAQYMLLSALCTDECGVAWPYVFGNGIKNVVTIDSLVAKTTRAEFAVVIEERRRRAVLALNAVAADDDKDGIATRVVKRRRTKS